MNDLKLYRILQSRGFTDDAAEEFVEALNENEDHITKKDLQMFESKILSEIHFFRGEIKNALNQIQTQNVIFMTLIFLAVICLKFFVR